MFHSKVSSKRKEKETQKEELLLLLQNSRPHTLITLSRRPKYTNTEVLCLS